MNTVLANKLNIAVGLWGIHFNSNYKHWMGWDCSIDFRKSIENYRDKLFIGDHNYSFYTATYKSSALTQLDKQYNFVKISTSDFVQQQGTTSHERNRKFLETLELIRDSRISYDFVLLTRYDLLFKTTPLLKPMSHNKINLLHGAKWGDDASIVDDNWYFFSYSMIDHIISTLQQHPLLHSHHYNRILPVQLLDLDHYWSHENPDYTIIRK